MLAPIVQLLGVSILSLLYRRRLKVFISGETAADVAPPPNGFFIVWRVGNDHYTTQIIAYIVGILCIVALLILFLSLGGARFLI